MIPAPRITFYHAPHSRSGGTLSLLEELGCDYDLHLLNLQTGTQRQPEYLKINPMGKVPAIRHGDALVTEQVAVMLYLADLHAEGGLAPPNGDADRGPYLRWMVYYASCFEPAVIDRAQQREPAPSMQSPYGSWDEMLAVLTDQLGQGPYLLGERFSAADVLWGCALKWTVAFQLVPDLPVIRDYIDRINARPAMRRAAEMDAELAARQERDTAEATA
ncbi:MAG TPA: glutathione S-transferase family protein [Gammaproteobacteria bacterium]|nr:glutathione S-transferase family protein [Gammaproteobacteria bacterium]